MKLYHQYDPITGKFLGSWKAQLDPIEKKYLHPNNTTFIAPPQRTKYQWPYWDATIINSDETKGNWVLKDSDIETTRKLIQKNEFGVSLYRRQGNFAIALSPEELDKNKTVKLKSFLKLEANKLKTQLLSDVLDKIIQKALTPEQLKYLNELNTIISDEVDPETTVLPFLEK